VFVDEGFTGNSRSSLVTFFVLHGVVCYVAESGGGERGSQKQEGQRAPSGHFDKRYRVKYAASLATELYKDHLASESWTA
jgi:hypothetical protein